MNSGAFLPPIRIGLSGSPWVLCAAVALVCAAAAGVMVADMSLLPTLLWLAGVAVAAASGLGSLRHGRCAWALRWLEWQGGDQWWLVRGDGRCARARLDVRSRRVGRAALLVFQRGTFGRFDRPWALVLPHMVNDPQGLRRVRVGLSVGAGQMHRVPGP